MPRYEWSPERFCETLETSGRSRADVARELGCSASLLTFYCLGHRQPPPPRLVALAEILGTTVEAFFAEVDDDAAAVPVYPPSDWRKRYPHRSTKAGQR